MASAIFVWKVGFEAEKVVLGIVAFHARLGVVALVATCDSIDSSAIAARLIDPLDLAHARIEQMAMSTKVFVTEPRRWRAIGSAQSAIAKAAAISQRWLEGIGSVDSLMRPQPTSSDRHVI